MKKFFSALAKITAFFLAVLLIVALPLSILAFNVGRVIFDQTLVTKVITDIVTESDLIPAGLAWFSETRAAERYASGAAEAWVGEPDVVHLIDFLTINNWRIIRWETLPNEILEEYVESTVDGTYKWIDSDDPIPQITWNLKSLIRRVDGEHGTKALVIAYEALPDCSPEQIADFKARVNAAPAGTQILYNLCEFPDPWREDQFSDYVEGLDDLVDNIPETFALTKELERTTDTKGIGPEALKGQLRLSRQLMTWAPLIPIGLLLIILLLVVRSLKSFGLWWGIPLTLGGILALVMNFNYRALITSWLTAGALSEVPVLIKTEAIAGILRLFAEVFRPMIWQTVILLAVSVVLMIVGILTKKEKNEIPDELEV